MKIRITTIALLALVLCGGCGTTIRHFGSRGSCMTQRGDGVYQGVRLDCSGIAQPQGASVVIVVLDLPFSLIADTLLLPYDLIDSARNKNDEHVESDALRAASSPDNQHRDH